VGIVSLNSCVQGDLDDLQNQIDDLSITIADLKQTQQESLLAAIANLEARLQALNSELEGDLSELVGNLELLEDEIKSNANAVYYGNVITDADYAALTAQNATIVTGRVVIASDANVQTLENVKLIGKSLEIMGGGTISMNALQSIGENLMISNMSDDASISFSNLASVGGDFKVANTISLTSITADEIVLISGTLISERNVALTTLSLSKLDNVNGIYIDEQVLEDYDNPAGNLTSLNLSSTNVNNSVEIHYLGAVENLTLGSVGGNLICDYSELAKITLNGTSVDGDFNIENNKFLASIDVPNLSRIEGQLRMVSNFDWNTPGSGLTSLPSFSALTYIGGDVTISNNSSLTSADAFNNVTEIRGENIEFTYNGNLDNINIFNALVDTADPASQWGDNSHANITINANTFWFNGFESLTETLNVNINIAKTAGVFNETTGQFEPGGDIAKFEGFNNITDVSALELNISQVTEFTAFGALNNFKNFQTYFTLYMPEDTTVGTCSISPILNRIKNGDFDSSWNPNKKAVFKFNWADVDRDTAIDQLLDPCN
jgi:hypothetical protein